MQFSRDNCSIIVIEVLRLFSDELVVITMTMINRFLKKKEEKGYKSLAIPCLRNGGMSKDFVPLIMS